MIDKTRITEMFGIQYPVIQAPMNWITGANLAAAVSNAGGLGTLGPNAGQTTPTYDPKEVAERLRHQIHKVRELTEKPFAVNLPVGGEDMRAISDGCVRVVIEEKAPVAVVVMGSPDMYTAALKDAGVKVVHSTTTVRQAVRAEKAGVHAVVASGYEGGGHLGRTDLTTMVLVPQVVNSVKIPVIAAGGISGGRGLVAAMALGAEAVYMGTRFIATRECDAHPDFKQRVLEAEDTGTVVIGKKIGRFLRTINNEFSREYMDKESRGYPEGELLKAWAYPGDASGHPLSRMYHAFVKGDMSQGAPAAGAISGAVNDIVSAGDLVRNIMAESATVLENLTRDGFVGEAPHGS